MRLFLSRSGFMYSLISSLYLLWFLTLIEFKWFLWWPDNIKQVHISATKSSIYSNIQRPLFATRGQEVVLQLYVCYSIWLCSQRIYTILQRLAQIPKITFILQLFFYICCGFEKNASDNSPKIWLHPKLTSGAANQHIKLIGATQFSY